MKSRAETEAIKEWLLKIDKDILAESLNKYKPETEVIN